MRDAQAHTQTDTELAFKIVVPHPHQAQAAAVVAGGGGANMITQVSPPNWARRCTIIGGAIPCTHTCGRCAAKKHNKRNAIG